MDIKNIYIFLSIIFIPFFIVAATNSQTEGDCGSWELQEFTESNEKIKINFDSSHGEIVCSQSLNIENKTDIFLISTGYVYQLNVQEFNTTYELTSYAWESGNEIFLFPEIDLSMDLFPENPEENGSVTISSEINLDTISLDVSRFIISSIFELAEIPVGEESSILAIKMIDIFSQVGKKISEGNFDDAISESKAIYSEIIPTIVNIIESDLASFLGKYITKLLPLGKSEDLVRIFVNFVRWVPWAITDYAKFVYSNEFFPSFLISYQSGFETKGNQVNKVAYLNDGKIYAISPEIGDSESTKLSEYSDYHEFEVFCNGTMLLAFHKEEEFSINRIDLINTLTGETTTVAPAVDQYTRYVTDSASISPDCSYVIYTEDKSSYITYSFSISEETRKELPVSFIDYEWYEGENRLLYFLISPGARILGLYEYDLQSNESKEIFVNENLMITNHSLVGNGQEWIAFTKNFVDGRGNLSIMSAFGEQKTIGGFPNSFDGYAIGLPMVEWSPDGKYLAFTTEPIYGTEDGLGIYDLENEELRLFQNFQGFNPSWSPDGKYIAFTGLIGSLELFEVDKEKPSTTTLLPDAPESALVGYSSWGGLMGYYASWDSKAYWSQDGDWLIFNYPEGFYILDVVKALNSDPDSYTFYDNFLNPRWVSHPSE